MSKTNMTLSNKDAYDTLSNSGLQWGRKDPNTIYVYTSGYKSHDHHAIEKYLMQAGMMLISEEFDRMCGKTIAVYRHK